MRRDIYEIQATSFSNIPLMKPKYKAVVHLESEEDEFFWDKLLQEASPSQYYYVYHSKSDNGLESKGCEQCLKYRPYLNSKFFICIDSDLRYLLEEKDLNVAHFVLQTYTYSWENHLCESLHLKKRLTDIAEVDFDFTVFLRSLSAAVYKPLLVLLYSQRTGKNMLNQKQFRTSLPTQLKGEEMSDSGGLYVEHLNARFENYIKDAKSQGWDEQGEIARYEKLGLNANNAYLHIRGHELFNMVQYIGTRICMNQQISFTNDVLKKDVPSSGYWEVEKILEDIKEIITE